MSHFLDCIDKIYNGVRWFGKTLPVFEPDRPFRYIFDIFMLVYLLTLIANIFLKYGFELSQENYYPAIWILFEVMPCYIFSFEVLLDLNTSYYSKGVYISSRAKILGHYVQYYLFLDMFTIIPLFFQGTKNGSFLEILVVFRLKNVEYIMKRSEEYLQLKGKKEGVFQLLKLMINYCF